ncbi:hypothetical protein K505DRAFT_326892 [Melanomma pulvis-pyrius CBS 109.77]|uniref:DUF7730 domain-containing protein n=1 Tax=Melanomma pulvis-pyrius CBS 109.77 TaxID=1314802 RepID=A0A6A6X5K7_9PLEO|nr:hypothetical protein K505DRAFT_326892 [Melanomma pulvis-pyrius CBS 109.77]
MAHFSPTTVASVHAQIMHTTPDSYAGLTSHPVPQLNHSAEEQSEWTHFDADLPYEPSHPCLVYVKRARDHFKRFVVPTPSPPFDPSQHVMPDLDHLSKWSKCHLLSLPKEVRLQIWRHVLTDTSISKLLVGIFREPSSPYKRHPRPAAPKFNVSLRRSVPININLLLANRFIYEEALPVLYSNAKFAPWDLEGLLPLFLDTLSPYARSCVRHIKLYLPSQVTSPTIRLDPSRPFFNWAITCAQVAKLNGSLHDVEIEGDWSIFEKKANRRAILAPLLKIKATKIFTPRAKGPEQTSNSDEEFQTLLAEVEQHFKANSKVRKERTEADALNRAAEIERIKRVQEAAAQAAEAQRQEDEANGMDREMEEWRRFAEANIKRMEKELSTVRGIEQFEKELKEHSRSEASIVDRARNDDESAVEDWDLVSVRSGASTPRARPASVLSKASDDMWTDTASTIVGKDDGGKYSDDSDVESDAESDAESESWEEL